MSLIAQRDKNADETGIYRVNSLYFDNCYDKALVEKNYGLEKREKFRIRYYNHDLEFIRLEKKSKISGMCAKQSVRLSAAQTQAILDGDIAWMRTSQEELICELWAKMQYQLLRPRNVVVYEREAFIYPVGNVRVTIDTDIRGINDGRLFLRPDAVALHLLHLNILEVKWDEFLPQIIRDAVQVENVKTNSFSKYAATRFSAF